MEIINLLKGKKTYLVSIISALTGLLAYLNGHESLSTALTNIPGLMVYVGGLAASLRAAAKKVEVKLDGLNNPTAVVAPTSPVVPTAYGGTASPLTTPEV